MNTIFVIISARHARLYSKRVTVNDGIPSSTLRIYQIYNRFKRAFILLESSVRILGLREDTGE